MAGETPTVPIIRTKLQRPLIVGDHVHRSQLLERFDQRRQRPLTLITAPAGYGKSALISCWLEACGLPAAWLSLEETAEYLQKMIGMTIEDSIVSLLGKKTEGWITGLRLAALSLRHREDLNRVLTDLPNDNRYVMDYMVAEVLSQQPPRTQVCLLKTSILNRLSAPLCQAVCAVATETGGDEVSGNEFLDWLIHANLFLIPLDDDHRWFRYHHLFQVLLQRLLKRKYSSDNIDALQRQD